MSTTTSEATIAEWVDTVNSAAALGEALGLTPCEALHTAFPAIVGDDQTMEALSTMLEPVIGFLGTGVAMGHLTPEGAEGAVHDIFHLLQIAAGLGHMLGVADAVGMAGDLPALDDIVWDDLPNFLAGEYDDDTAAEAVSADDSDDSEGSGQEDS